VGRFAAAADSPATRCSFGAYLEGLPEEERDELVSFAASRSIQFVRDIVDEVDGVGFDKHTIARHLKGKCRCRAS
jgi:hypothetical protein